MPHDAYRQLTPEQVVEWAGKPIAIIDCFGLLDDATIARYFELGCEVRAWGAATSSASSRRCAGLPRRGWY